MVIVMEKHTAESNIEHVMSELISRGFDVHRSTGSDQTILGIVGDVASIDPREDLTAKVAGDPAAKSDKSDADAGSGDAGDGSTLEGDGDGR